MHIDTIVKVWADRQSSLTHPKTQVFDDLPSSSSADKLCAGPSYHFSFNLGRFEFEYFSSEVEEVLGREASTLDLQTFIGHIHPDDIDHVTRCERLSGQFLLEQIPAEQITKYKVCYSFRLMRRDGSYGLFLHQLIPVEVQGTRLARNWGIHTDISHLGLGRSHQISFLAMAPNLPHVTLDSRTGQPITEPVNPFSPREIDVLRLSAEGLTIHQTADQLNISPGTVRVHRSNILRKSKCHNLTQAVAKSIRKAYI